MRDIGRARVIFLFLSLPGFSLFSGSLERPSFFLDVPFIQQEKNACGAAALAMVFNYWGKNISQYAILAKIYDPSTKSIRGEDLRAYAEDNGFEAFLYGGELGQLRVNIQKGRPVIVALNSGSARVFHYVVVVGYDDGASRIILHDPRGEKSKRMAFDRFLSRWSRSRYWSLLLVPNETLPGCR